MYKQVDWSFGRTKIRTSSVEMGKKNPTLSCEQVIYAITSPH